MPASTAPGDIGTAEPGELDAVRAALAQARAGVPEAAGVPAVPDADEVAALTSAHDILRSTLDRVDRAGG